VCVVVCLFVLGEPSVLHRGNIVTHFEPREDLEVGDAGLDFVWFTGM
jgi:hypothetical protein